MSPVFPGQPAPIDQVREIYDAVKMSNDRFVSLKAGGPDLNKTDPLEPRFMAIFNQLRLEVEMSSTRTFDTPIRTSPKM